MSTESVSWLDRRAKEDPRFEHVVHTEETRAGVRLLPEQWDERFPEQERRYLDPESVAALDVGVPEARVAFEEVFCEELRAGIVKLGIDPFTKRYTIWQLAANDQWEKAMIISEKYDSDDALPRDLEEMNFDGRYDRYEGRVGEFKVPTADDFGYLKAISDHWLNTDNKGRLRIGHKYLSRKEGAKRELAKRLSDREYAIAEHSYSQAYKLAVQSIGGGQHYNFLTCTSVEETVAEVEEERYVDTPVCDAAGEVLYTRREKRLVMDRIPARRVMMADGRIVTIVGELEAPRLLNFQQLDGTDGGWVDVNEFHKILDLEPVKVTSK